MIKFGRTFIILILFFVPFAGICQVAAPKKSGDIDKIEVSSVYRAYKVVPNSSDTHDVYVCSGGPTRLTGETETPTPDSYQWQIFNNSNSTWENASGATNKQKDYTTPFLPSGSPNTDNAIYAYRRQITTGGVVDYDSYYNVHSLNVLIGNYQVATPTVPNFCTSGDPGPIIGSLPTGGFAGFTYQWYNSPDGIFFNPIVGATGKDYDPPLITATTYYYRQTTTTDACATSVPSSVVSINILPLPAVPVPVATSVPVCEGNKATLSVNNPQSGTTYTWYDSPAKTNVVGTGSTFITDPVTADKTYYVDAQNGICTSSTAASVQVTISAQVPGPIVDNDNVSTCYGTQIQLSVKTPQPGTTYNWYLGNDNTPSHVGPDYLTPALTVGTNAYVEAVINGGTCTSGRTTIRIAVLALPDPPDVQNTLTCPGTSANLTTTVDDPFSTVNWYTSATGGTPVFTGDSFTTPPLNTPVTYYVEETNSDGCTSATRGVVTVSIATQLSAPVVKESNADISSITFSWDAVSGATGYQVSTDNGQTFTDPSSGNDGLTHTVTGLTQGQTVTIIVRAFGDLSCQLSANSLPVTGAANDIKDEVVFVANAFTPNGDGRNDVLYVHGENIKSMNFYVYDQWGEMLFRSSTQSAGWDGNYKGNREPVGVYVYYLQAIMYNGQKINKKGTITLLR